MQLNSSKRVKLGLRQALLGTIRKTTYARFRNLYIVLTTNTENVSPNV